jgi:hypothetical protein
MPNKNMSTRLQAFTLDELHALAFRLNLAEMIERIRLTNPIWSAASDFAQLGG